MDGCCHNNTARHEHLPKKTKAMQYYVATKGLLKRWNASFRKVSGKCIAMDLKEGRPSASWK